MPLLNPLAEKLESSSPSERSTLEWKALELDQFLPILTYRGSFHFKFSMLCWLDTSQAAQSSFQFIIMSGGGHAVSPTETLEL